MSKPSPSAYPGMFQEYVALVPEEDLADAFNKQTPIIRSFLSSISEEKSHLIYAPGKWSIKEVLQHIIDAERIFSYRALCFARKEKIALPGFEENDYAANSNADARSWQSLGNEFLIVRQSTHLLFNSFTPEMLQNEGKAWNYTITPEAVGFQLLGHFYHHKKIVEERYLEK
ncbi:DinB family protein [Ferruginibacter albus]|uniref:DinB family protein n=1 Tax=Ferruginibacter albus TaxID=2875540 RepID=UPI001CC7507B|nr:DinB family protein [Ferruginibacter albus]UAY53166.1 DinB family protein [Ferruginibacter albus]